MRSPFAGLLALVLLAAAVLVVPARAELLITVDKSAQRMTVNVDGDTRYVWPVSTGAPGYDTPSGEFKPFRMEAEHFSREWDDAPMPHSIFFTQQGHAIHGSNHNSMGRPASHGCVRLEPKNAAILFALVKEQKMANTHVVLTGETPGSAPVVAKRDNGEADYTIYREETTGSLPPPQRRVQPLQQPQRAPRIYVQTQNGWREVREDPRDYQPYYDNAPRRRYYPGPFQDIFGR